MTEFFQRIIRHFMDDNELVMDAFENQIEKTQGAKDILIASELPLLLVGRAHSVGKHRSQNEDAILTLVSSVDSASNHIHIGLFLVADGMGGHHHGDLASEIAVQVFSTHILQSLSQLLSHPQPEEITASIQESMQEGTLLAHNQIAEKVPGGGSTLTAALVVGNQLTISHVGDSRAYSINFDGAMQVLTKDHSLVKRMVELGQITPEEGAVHPQRNVLYRALGPVESIDPDISSHSFPPSSRLLLCSDGLWGVLPDERILELIQNSQQPHTACQQLVNAANKAGGPDNISVILVENLVC